tara:strand:+ start:14401 stop:14589 length:189 start_codon:yes stop_codon:yes gene_type:complete
VTKENSDLIGKLCLYRDIPVLVLKEYSIIPSFIYSEENIKYEVLFPQGGIDTVSAQSLKVIK